MSIVIQHISDLEMDDVNGNMGHSLRSIKVNSEGLGLKSVDLEADIDKQIQWKKRNVYQNYTNIEQRKTYMPDKTLLEIERAIQPLIEDRQKLREISGTLQTIRYQLKCRTNLESETKNRFIALDVCLSVHSNERTCYDTFISKFEPIT